MNILCTGLSGNLGQEIAKELKTRNHTLIALTRKRENLLKSPTDQIYEHDLLSNDLLEINSDLDCILHNAGNIRFHSAGDDNKKMITKLIEFAKKKSLPFFFVSTAYTYHKDKSAIFNNTYEQDKYNAEQQLINSGLKYGIFRPSVLVGNSKTGHIQSISGFYAIVKALIVTLTDSKLKNKILRFPNIQGKSDLVPVDHAAFHIGQKIDEKDYDIHFVTNPNPPDTTWLLNETLDFFELKNRLKVVNKSFDQFIKLDLTQEEQKMYKFILNFYPYWIMNTPFPQTICSKNLIDHKYLNTAFTYLTQSGLLNT